MRHTLIRLVALVALAACGKVDAFTDGGVDVDGASADGAVTVDAATAVDAPALIDALGTCGPEGSACATNGGSTCCGGVCSHTAVAGACDACAVTARGPQRIAIIESQSSQTAHDMDVRWRDVATAMGHTATVLPQTALDDLAGLAAYEILIVSSGILDVPANRRATIDGFAASRRGVYLQAEYQTIYATNVGLGEIVNAHGGTFAWTGTVTGQQDPTTVNGCLATTPYAAPMLTAYWYAAAGTASGPGVETIHTAPGGQAIGWMFCLPGGGLVISNTDQDFIRTPAAGTLEHMRNVLVHLADAPSCGTVIPPVG